MVEHYNFEDGIGKMLRIIHNNQQNNEQDIMIIIAGGEGSGKSRLTLLCCDYLHKLKGVEMPVEFLKNVCGSIRSFSEAVHRAPKKQIYVLDDGRELDSKNWNHKHVRAFEKWISMNRIAGNIYFICFPNPLSMTRYVRNDKMAAAIILDKSCFGTASIFLKDKFDKAMEKIKEKKGKDLLKETPDYYSNFSEYKGALLEPYLVKKDAWNLESGDDFFSNCHENGMANECEESGSLGDVGEDSDYLITTGEAGRKLSVSTNNIDSLIKKGVFKVRAVTPGGLRRLSNKDVIYYKNHPQRRRPSPKPRARSASGKKSDLVNPDTDYNKDSVVVRESGKGNPDTDFVSGNPDTDYNK